MNTIKSYSARVSIIVAIATVAVVVIGLSLWQDAHVSRALSSAELRVLRTAQISSERAHGSELALRGETIAGNQAVTGYIAQALDNVLPGTEPDYASVVDLLEERRSQLKLSMVAILSQKGSVLATTDRMIGPLDFGDSLLFRSVRESKRAKNGLLIHEDRLLDMRILPLAEYGFSEIYLLVALPLDQTFARSLVEGAGEGSKADVALLLPTPQGVRVVASTLSPSAAEALPSALSVAVSDTAGGAAKPLPDGNLWLELAGAQRLAEAVPLFGDADARVLLIAPADVDSVAHASLRLPLQIGCVLALLAVGIASWWFWRRWLAPIESLLRVLEYAADSGDLQLKVKPTGSPLVSRVGAAFNRLCVRVASSSRA